MQKIKYTPLSPAEKRKYAQKQILAKIVSILVILVNLASIGFALFLAYVMLLFNITRSSDWMLVACLLIKGLIGIKFSVEVFRDGLSSSIVIEEIISIVAVALIYFGRSIINGINIITSDLLFIPIVSIIIIVLLICILSYVLVKNRLNNNKKK